MNFDRYILTEIANDKVEISKKISRFRFNHFILILKRLIQWKSVTTEDLNIVRDNGTIL